MFAFSHCGSGFGTQSPSKYLPKGCPGHSYDSNNDNYKCIPGGTSIGPINENSAGTLGCFAVDPDGDVVGLTNNHVIGMQVYDPCVQPTIEYLISFDGDSLLFKNSLTLEEHSNPSFDGNDFPMLEAGRKYIFTCIENSSDNAFYITSELKNKSKAYENVTITKFLDKKILYKDGLEINNSGRTSPFISSGESIEFQYKLNKNKNFNQLYYDFLGF